MPTLPLPPIEPPRRCSPVLKRERMLALGRLIADENRFPTFLLLQVGGWVHGGCMVWVAPTLPTVEWQVGGTAGRAGSRQVHWGSAQGSKTALHVP